MVLGRPFDGRPAIIICTGPSLDAPTRERVRALRDADRCRLFGINNTYRDFPNLDVLTACDPKWWEVYGEEAVDYLARSEGRTAAWHWDRAVCDRYWVNHIRGQWEDGLSLDPRVINYGHCSSYQALGLAVHYGCGPLVLVGFDMRYPVGGPRHYFTDLSDDAGEYPDRLRKFSTFDGLHRQFQTIADQAHRLPPIINATPGSAFKGFRIQPLDEVFPGV